MAIEISANRSSTRRYMRRRTDRRRGLARDTAEAMSEANAELLKRAVDAYNRRDVEALLEELDPEVEWLPALPGLLVQDAQVYRGHEGIREMLRDFCDVLDEIHLEYSQIRDLGDRVGGDRPHPHAWQGERGGDRIPARQRRHLPQITGTDNAIWDRIRLVPFGVRIEESEKDEELGAKLLEELPGILRWAVEGCASWQAQKLGAPGRRP